MRRTWIAVAALLGCGRSHFDAVPADAGASDAPIDAPPLPAFACAQSIHRIDRVENSTADLAVSSGNLGYTAAWTSGGGAVIAAQFDKSRQPVGNPVQLVAEGIATIAGLESTPERTWMVTSAGPAQQTLWDVALDLSSLRAVLSESSLTGIEPIGSGTVAAARPIWIRGVPQDNALRLAYLNSNGEVGVDATYITSEPVTALSVADFTDHVHLAWRLGNAECYGVDVDFNALPQVAGPSLISAGCNHLRIVSGSEANDPLVTVWDTDGGTVEVKYTGASIPTDGTAFTTTLGPGRAPKISFDGNLYWVAWRADDGLRVAYIDKAGVTRQTPVAGTSSIGDESFELVRRGSSVDLAILGGDALSFLTLCVDRI